VAIKAEDVVLVKLPDKPRPFWLLGKVLELIVGHDSIVRSARIKRADGREVFHSINHLYPLELNVLQPGHHPHSTDPEISTLTEDGEMVGVEGAGEGATSDLSAEGDQPAATEPPGTTRPLRRAARNQRSGLRHLVARGLL
jgi:hypothetical protein